MSLVVPEKFQHILRVMNTNIDGRRKIMFAMTSIKGEQIECISSCNWAVETELLSKTSV